MKKNDPVKNVAITDVISIQEGQKISDARHVMCNQNIHHVPVVSGTKLVGIVSFTDMMKINLMIEDADERSIDAIIDQQFALADVMTTNLVTANSKSTVREVAILLSDNNFHSLPLVDDDGNLAGIVTSTDLIKYLVDQY